MKSESGGEAFAGLVSGELKGAITAHGHTAKGVAKAIGKDPSVLATYLSGKRAIPLSVLYDVCEVIGLSTREVVERALARVPSPPVTTQ